MATELCFIIYQRVGDSESFLPKRALRKHLKSDASENIFGSGTFGTQNIWASKTLINYIIHILVIALCMWLYSSLITILPNASRNKRKAKRSKTKHRKAKQSKRATWIPRTIQKWTFQKANNPKMNNPKLDIRIVCSCVFVREMFACLRECMCVQQETTSAARRRAVPAPTRARQRLLDRIC